ETNSTTRLTINSSGNVGIGTTSPGEKLVVDGKVIINNTNPPNNLAQLNIGYTGGGETRAIDIDGSWSANESKSITFTYGSAASEIVGQINCVLVNGTDTRLRWGKLYHNANSSTYTMELKSTSTTTANLTVAGSIQMANDTATASAAKVGTMRYRTGTEYVEVTGTELVTNGNFATDANWTKGTGVTIASGVGTWTNTANNVGLTQLITFTNNAYYRCNVTVSNYSSGSFRFRYPGISSPRITANGTYSLIIQANQATNDTLYLQGETNGDANVNFSIDNVSVVEVTAEDASYADMCMQTGASTYEWVNIVRNTY
ncbi:MAG: hypothetical protein GY787_11100, partial [Alteromonadales bacterium]|nr:hypothetical protein [Alteromonadales bacterium]